MDDYLKARVKDVYVKIITGIVRWLLGNVLYLGYTIKETNQRFYNYAGHCYKRKIGKHLIKKVLNPQIQHLFNVKPYNLHCPFSKFGERTAFNTLECDMSCQVGCFHLLDCID